MKIKFLGAAKLVTGSNYYIETENIRFIIDCGLFQGTLIEENLNYSDFEFDPNTLDFMILSHAHIDHSGRIPLLVKQGFKGKIYTTHATRDLAEILLQDSGKIHEADTSWENKKRQRAGLDLVDPLYTADDAITAAQYFNPIYYDKKIIVNEWITLRLSNAGHLLGSSIVEMWITENEKTSKVVFSGDLGMHDIPMLNPPTEIKSADYLIVESTYGNRVHKDIKTRINKLLKIIVDTAKLGGTTIIPSFAVGRTQEIIFELLEYIDDSHLKEEFLKIPIYADSPLAIEATGIFIKNADILNIKVKNYLDEGKNPLKLPNLHLVKNMNDSIRLNSSEHPKVIISASGMCDAGRIKHHLKHYLWKDTTSIIFVGYQAEGTLGRKIKEGEEMVNILDSDIKVAAHIFTVEGFSGHADQRDLLAWVSNFDGLKKTFIVHGELDSAIALSELLDEQLEIETYIPDLNEEIKLE